MTVQASEVIRNARLNAIESAIGTSPILRIYSGIAPSNCAGSATGTLLAQMTLPSDWLGSASGGNISKLGVWEDASANTTGEAGYFRIYNSAGSVCHMQGSVTLTGYAGELMFDDISFVLGDPVTIATFVITDGNV